MRRLTRSEAIDDLRAKLSTLVDEDTCVCQAVGKAGIFCRGLARLKSYELSERYDWIARTRARITRRELEDLVYRWQLARQFVTGTTLACDTEQLEQRGCRGWDDFDDATLARFHQEVCGEGIEIAPEALPPADTHARS
jgi:hypothetical protein